MTGVVEAGGLLRILLHLGLHTEIVSKTTEWGKLSEVIVYVGNQRFQENAPMCAASRILEIQRLLHPSTNLLHHLRST
ncbi:mCG147221 [Mus musculus]|nr:mCG147221 [Mus musculus]